MSEIKPSSRVRDIHAVRWYVLSLPSCHKGPSKGLDQELERRKRDGEPLFDYFAPTFVEIYRRDNRWVKSNRPLLYNYLFIRSSVYEIFKIKRNLPWYNFLRSVGRDGIYPYLSEREMENLRWVARSYMNELPLYMPEASSLREGDRVRVIEGRFKGVEASVVIQPGVGDRDVMVAVDNWLWVPLLRVKSGEYEVIALNEEGKHLYTKLDNPRIQNGLHEAMGRYWRGELRDADRDLANEVLRQYGELRLDSSVMRCKLYSMLLPAYTILGDEERKMTLVSTINAFLPLISAEQSKALLLLTLYGCTDSSIHHERAHQIIDPWRGEERVKRIKQQLIDRLADYDGWLNH